LAAPVGAELLRFSELVRTLRERCPWDRAQTHGSLRPFVIEEAYEVADAIDRLVAAEGAPPDVDPGIDELEEELGDLLFQVVFHATLAAEEGWFTLADVARHVHDKLVHRHPHVFGEVDAPDAGTVVANWEQIKRDEKGRASVMDGIPAAFPPRLFAAKVAKRAAKVGVEADLAAEEAELDRAEAALLAAARRIEAAARAREAG
jgi:MazG family protein